MPRQTFLLRPIVSMVIGIGLVLLQGCGTDDVAIAPKGEGEWNNKPAQEEGEKVDEPRRYAWTVTVGDFFFGPPDAAVESASTVTWINVGSEPHTVSADDGTFDSGALSPGDSFTVAFEGEGPVTYHCAIHPSMVGSVTIGGGGPAP